MKVAVLGAGVSGITIAKKLVEKNIDVVVYEKCSEAGGLAKTRITDNYVYDLHGGHIFNSKHKEIVDWVFSFLPKEQWQYSVRNAKIYFNGRYVSYPFELSLSELESEDATNCIYDFMMSQQGDEPDNFHDWLIWNFGQAIAEYYMIPYNAKIWSYSLKEMETRWMQGKMPLPEKKDIIRSLLLKDPKERKMPHSTYYYPLNGGIQTMINALTKGLDIKLNTPVIKIENLNGKWLINGEGNYDRVISTLPLPILSDTIELPNKVISAIRDLKYNSLTTMLYKCPETDLSWLYIPSSDYKSHRVCYQGAFSTYACPTGCSAAIEVIGNKFEVKQDILEKQSIIPAQLGLYDLIDTEYAEFAYVIHDKNYRKNTNIIKDYFNAIDNFDLLGRFATWNYNNMDICMLDAFKLAENINA
ncbi:O-antigen synthesis protein WbyH [Anaerocolumna cellulosilytica]|uniref:O-antigen synthesis protein WbyH n=1 Tax=Anaerocolumna cellulosilytica TaxID=433286 RepID=A0A6S6R1I0_9FIRM|nr:FAD-dependent oxidoreductase [Anaerocolumna cellulosilytica]MBB5194447.1 protoporphyrinogen oxidase [Anaerocolumna cellulosilytica]BCJ93392.1 O-antigen synthesis protein WbyH [Anaerocolumna cellulosilytica]